MLLVWTVVSLAVRMSWNQICYLQAMNLGIGWAMREPSFRDFIGHEKKVEFFSHIWWSAAEALSLLKCNFPKDVAPKMENIYKTGG